MSNKELNEKQLNDVSGGLGRQRSISVPIDIPEFSQDVTIKVYLDNQLDTSKTRTVDCGVRQVVYTFSGSGKKTLIIKFNDIKTKKYEIDFEDGSYIIID